MLFFLKAKCCSVTWYCGKSVANAKHDARVGSCYVIVVDKKAGTITAATEYFCTISK